MERFFELRMRNGRSFIVTTNEEGVSKFSINGVEYSIFSTGMEGESYTFSVEKIYEVYHFQINPSLEVLSLREINARKKTGDESINEYIGELKESLSQKKRSFLAWNQNFFSASKGGVHTPDGWVLA